MDDKEVRVVKGILLLALCLLAGCTAGPTLEQLEATALVTGDWSAVEARERSIQRRNMRSASYCPQGYVAVCEKWTTDERCSCVQQRQVFSVLRSH